VIKRNEVILSEAKDLISIETEDINMKTGIHIKHSTESGYTLFEMIVAVFVFSFIAIVATGAFVQGLRLQRLAFNTQLSEEAARFIMESISREIRVANVINNPDNGCLASPPVTSLTIDHPVNGVVSYSRSGTAILRTVGGETAQISSSDVRINRLDFYCIGTATGDNRQPRVMIAAQFESGSGDDMITIDVETSASQRTLSN
jgi:Tfp pilus assembly protein FimT